MYGLAPRILKKIMDTEAMTSPVIVPPLDELSAELQLEAGLYNEPETWMQTIEGDSSLGKCPLQFWRNGKIQKKFPLLNILALKILTLEVTNVTVERSMKTLGSIMTEKRNRLGLSKVNEEMLIKFNQNTSKLNELKVKRMEKVYSEFRTKWNSYNITEHDEKHIINLVDSYDDPMKYQLSTKTDSQKVETTRTSRKTKEFQLIESNPDYLPKKRSSRNIGTSQIDVSDEENDDSYKE